MSARYEPGGEKIQFARGYARRGQVWGDIQLFTRGELVESLNQGLVLVTGRSGDLAGDFDVISAIELGPDEQLLIAGNSPDKGDELELPIL